MPADSNSVFAQTGSALEKYAAVFNAVEINSCFYRSHKKSTYQKWASQVAKDFKFSVKLPRTITHQQKLRHIEGLVKTFSEEVSGLGSKLGCVLVQLPASLKFSEQIVELAFGSLHDAFVCPIVCEPRHPTWFCNEVNEVFTEAGVARVAADPALCVSASVPGGAEQTCYFRLHGSPRTYYSDYSRDYIQRYARLIIGQKQSSEVWCIFDNTASGRATSNASTMQKLLSL